jgi:hypothetical protein
MAFKINKKKLCRYCTASLHPLEATFQSNDSRISTVNGTQRREMMMMSSCVWATQTPKYVGWENGKGYRVESPVRNIFKLWWVFMKFCSSEEYFKEMLRYKRTWL